MADNYLEKQMEDFRAGKLGARRHATASSAKSPSILPTSAKILVIASGIDFAMLALEALAPSGCKMALAIEASPQATALTQRMGVRFYPQRTPIEGETPTTILPDLIHAWLSHSILILSDVPAINTLGHPAVFTSYNSHPCSDDPSSLKTAILAAMALANANTSAFTIEAGNITIDFKK